MSDAEGQVELADYRSLNKDLLTLSSSSTVQDVELLYDKWATKYDKDLTDAGIIPSRSAFVDAFNSLLIGMGITNKDVKILDLAAGTGLVGIELYKRGFTNIDAIDVSQGMLDEAKKKNVYKKVICAPVTENQTPGIETGEYDAVVLKGAFTYAHIKPGAVDEIVRTVKPGGVVIFAMRRSQLKHYEGKFRELEERNTWKLMSQEPLQYFTESTTAPEYVFFGYMKCP